MKRPSAVRAFVMLFFLALLISCSSYRGYGVLVWKNENLPFPVGEFLSISSIFSVDNYYEVDYQGQFVQVPMWQVQFFENYDDAREFHKEFQDYTNKYVFTLKYDGLPVRMEQKSTSGIVFKLKTGKVAKVIGKSKEPEKIAGFDDYWYQVLTEEGYRGYIYGYYLKVIDDSSDVKKKVDELMAEDPALDRFLNNIWRPAGMKEMVETGRIDMEYVDKNYGLIPKPNENKIILNNEDMSKEYTYTSIKKLTGDTYEVEGTDLKIQIFPSDKVYVSYLRDNAYTTREFILLKKDFEEIARSENDRRQNLLFQFINRGSVLTSTTYGTIRLDEKFRFTWTDFSALRSIIPSGVNGNGTVKFSRYLGPLVGDAYAGAVTFVFDEYPDRGVTFVYEFTAGGVRFVYIAYENIEKNEIRRVGHSPLVIVFNFQ